MNPFMRDPSDPSKFVMRCFGPYLVVKHLPADDVTAGGIVIPDVAKKKLLRGLVVVVGPGYPRSGIHDETTQHAPLEVEVGQTVIYGDFVGEEFELDGVKHHKLHEEHVLAIIEET